MACAQDCAEITRVLHAVEEQIELIAGYFQTFDIYILIGNPEIAAIEEGVVRFEIRRISASLA